MKLLSIDPGAERCGWAVIEYNDCVMGDGVYGINPYLAASGVLATPRQPKEKFQPYRLRVEKHAVDHFSVILGSHPRIRTVATEIVPAQGLEVSTQLYLSSAVAAVTHALAYARNIPVMQIAAVKVQKLIGVPGRTGKITKIGVRNGVHKFFPQLKGQKLWPDETDAIAIGLASLGLKTM